MPISDLGIHRTANMLMKQRGEDGATANARSRIDDLGAAGDHDGVAAWSRILLAIGTLSNPPSEARNWGGPAVGRKQPAGAGRTVASH